jgi:tetratricopeptide (TPR) repeat protein
VTGAEWARVAEAFDALRERTAAERAAWLDGQAADDTTRTEVAAMLRAYDSDPAFLEPAGAVAEAVLARGLAGRRLGAYRLVREIGRGGMGIVFEAHRDDEEFDRRAAIKVLPAWSASTLVERFRFERRVLAGLDHPGIAKLLDAGTTEDGQPYFVMELVDGRPIDAWCRDRQAPAGERCRLVERVCEALAYAHQHLVIHRDVKAANILVTPAGEPKLLDFGIAALLADDGAASAGLTRTGHHSFTPEYASPEQIRGERVTTATDVYSLGVVLYRLLAERPPYDLSGLSTFDAMRKVCEVEPPAMSTVAELERRAVLRGDLDRIVAKALRKSPLDRYGTVAELAADLRAWREGRPVAAATQSVAYRVRRFTRRNRGTVAAGVALLAVLLAGAGTTAWQARVASRERDKAQQRFHQIRELSRSLIFDVHDALRPVAGATEARRLLLDRAVQFLDRLAADAGDDDALKVELAEGYRRLGSVQGAAGVDNLGDTSGALASLEKAARLAEDARRADPAARLPLFAAVSTQSDLALVAHDAGRADAAARADARRLELAAEIERRYGDGEAIRVLASAYSDAGIFRAEQEDLDGARRYYGTAVRIYERTPAAARADQGWGRAYSLTLKRLGAVEMVKGALDDSEAHYRAALAIEEGLARQEPGGGRWPFETSYTFSDLGLIASRRGNADEAVRLWTRALELRRHALVGDPKNVRFMSAVAATVRRLGGAHLDAGRWSLAVDAFEEELRLRDALIAIQGPLAQPLREQGWALAGLAQARLDRAGAGGAGAAEDLRAARAALARMSPEAVAAGGTSLGETRDRLAARLAAAR